MYKQYKEYGTTLHTYEFNPKDERFSYEFGIDMKLETINKLPRPKADEETICVINWNFFDWVKSFNGYGEIEKDGIQYQKPILAFPSISFKDNKLSFGDLPNSQIGAGIGAKLIVDGKVNVIRSHNLITINKDARTAFGQKANGNILIVVAEGDDAKKKGVTSIELANFMLKLGCIIACQGDCGGSSSMIIDNKFVYNQGRAIACGLCVYRKKSTKKDMRKIIAKTKLNIRKTPMILPFNKIVEFYKYGDIIEVLETKGSWARTSLGWVSSDYLVKV